jgi:hypothetical protein
MSDMERNKGKLYPTYKTCKNYCDRLGIDISEYGYEDHREYLLDHHNYNENYDQVAVIDGYVYKVEFEVKREINPDSFVDVSVGDMGVIHFHTLHYNGCDGWEYLVEEKLNKKSIKD